MKMKFKAPRLDEVPKTARTQRSHNPPWGGPTIFYLFLLPTSRFPKWRGRERVVQEQEIMCAKTQRLSDVYVGTSGTSKEVRGQGHEGSGRKYSGGGGCGGRARCQRALTEEDLGLFLRAVGAIERNCRERGM